MPVYLRGIPAQVVREAKAIAARRGITFASFVAETLARAVAQPAQPVDDEPEARDAIDDVSRELRWFERARDQLALKYDGEFVAIIDNRVVDHDESFEALAGRMFAAYGARSIFMPQVRAEGGRRVQLRSPRTSRMSRGA